MVSVASTGLRKTLIEDLPISGVTIVSANKIHKFSANQTTTSNTMVDVDATNAAITATLTGGGTADVSFDFAGAKFAAGSAFLRITDGTNSSTEAECEFLAGVGIQRIFWKYTSTPSVSTTYKLQYRSNDANAAAILEAVAVRMSILEIK
jgi:hypothetical protein